MALLDKKAMSSWKNEHDFHVLAIMRTEKVSKSVATVQAYHEGIEGLAKRQPPVPVAAK